MVVRLTPFQRTEAPFANPAPFKVRVVAALPGEAAVGTRGWCRTGIGFRMVEELPVPVRVAGIGETAVVKVTFTEAERLPEADGVKLTLSVQEPPAVIVVQLLVWEKSAALAPWIVIEETRAEFRPTFERVSVCTADLVPTFCVSKVRLPGKKLVMEPVPLRVTT